MVLGEPVRKHMLDLCSHFDAIPASDRHTHKHSTTANTCASIASRGNKRQARVAFSDINHFFATSPRLLNICSRRMEGYV